MHIMNDTLLCAPSDFIFCTSQHIIIIGCRRAKYCGRECQKLDWKNHKASCQSVSFRGEGGDNKEEVADIQHMMTWYVYLF